MDTEQFECLAAQALVGRYLTGDDLPPESQAELEGHLETCQDCRELLAKKKAELLAALQTDSAPPSPATAEPETEREIPQATALEQTTESEKPATAELTPAQISAMMAPTAAVPDGVELVFDDAELPTASAEPVVETPEPVVAEVSKPAAKASDDILKTGLDEDFLDDLLGNMPEPYVAPEPDPELVATKEASAEAVESPELVATESQTEETSEKEKPRIRVRVEGLPILLGKNLKTLAYSASLGLVLVAMTSFAKNPSTVFGEKALAHKTDSHGADPHKAPEGHETPKKDDHGDVPKPTTDEHSKDEHSEEKPVTEDHAVEPKPQPEEHTEDKPDEHVEPKKDDIHQRMNKFESKAERDARMKKAADEHAEDKPARKPDPAATKVKPHSSPRVSQPDSYMVARPSGQKTTHAKADDHGPKPKPTTRVTKTTRTKKSTPHHAPTKVTKRPAAKPAAKKPNKPAGLKIYDEHGNPIN